MSTARADMHADDISPGQHPRYDVGLRVLKKSRPALLENRSELSSLLMRTATEPLSPAHIDTTSCQDGALNIYQ